MEKARIIKVNRGQYTLASGDLRITATLSGKLKYRNQYPVIGDYVRFDRQGGQEAVVQEILERKGCLGRPDGNGHADAFVKNYQEQVMAANVDYLFIVTSMNDDFSINRIIRYAVTSVRGGCQPVIILTKADLCQAPERFLREVKEADPDIEAFCVSAVTGEGIDNIRKFLVPGVTIALMGSSGVGKSTFINALAGSEVMKTSAIREKDAKGRHTTTHREMIDVNGTFIIDTPGMREFAICDVEEELDDTFRDIKELISRCRFSNCHHGNEPGCAVRAALESGALPDERWEMYRSLTRESKRLKRMSAKKK